MSSLRATRWLTLPGVLLAISSCGDSSGPNGGGPAAIAIVSGDAQTGPVAAPLGAPLIVRVTSGSGQPVSNVQVSFTVASGGGSLSVGSALTGQDGAAQTIWTLGTRVTDQHRVVATVATSSASVNVTFRATPTAGSAAAVTISSGNAQTRPPGLPLLDSLAALVTDAHGNPVTGAAVNWSVTGGGGSISPTSSVTDANGIARARWTLGPNLGANTATASVGGVTASATFSAQAVAAPTITQITPNPLVPGAIATITGTNFAPQPAGNAVTFGSSIAQVQQATTTQLTVVVPCEASGNVTVQVAAGGQSVQANAPLSVPNPINLTAGQSILLPAGAVCREVNGGGRYMLAVVNGVGGATSAGFRLRGAGPGSEAPLAIIPEAVANQLTPNLEMDDELRMELKHRRAHRDMLQKNLDLVRQLGAPQRLPRSEADIAAQAAIQQATVGDTIQLKIPDIQGNLCTTKATVRGRVVYEGTRGVVLEDIAAPIANQMDSIWRLIGQEFDNVHYNILTTNFGNPLALDGQLDNNGKVLMLFSKVVNDFETVAGFVSSGNFFSVAQCGASNLAEIFYGVVPTVPGFEYGTGSEDNPANWHRLTRSIVIHEAKHITAFAERLSRGATSNEESWLEEATAVLAEELFARNIFGFAHMQNTTFDESLFCERRPVPSIHPARCWHKPFVMYGYFALVHQYLSGMETRSPLGPIATDDASFYGSGWSFVRWAADQYGTTEPAFLRALTQTTLRGAANLEQRTGKPLAEMLVDWAIAHALDDWPDAGTIQPVHTMPSWNTRDIYARMSGELPQFFPTPFPLAPRPLAYGTFGVEVSGVRAGSTALFDLSGTATGAQLIQLTGPQGAGVPSPDLRLKIVRVQ